MKELLSAQQVQAGVARLAHQIAETYQGRSLTIVGVMTGSLLLLADLIRQLPVPLRVGVLQTSSYRGGTQRGALQINTDGLLDIRGRDVLLVDDIFDTGHTLDQLRRLLQAYQPLSVRSAVLLIKKGRQQVTYRPEFVAFEIPDVFVVGYGLDYQDHYRNLPFVAALEDEDLREGGP